jgi:hypothetical protein
MLKLLYILFGLSTLFTLYHYLHKTGRFSPKFYLIVLSTFIVITLLHLDFIRPPFLLRWETYSLFLSSSIGIVFFNYAGRYSIAKTQQSQRLSDFVREKAVKMSTFMYLKLPYLMIGFVEILVISLYPSI